MFEWVVQALKCSMSNRLQTPANELYQFRVQQSNLRQPLTEAAKQVCVVKVETSSG